MTGDSLATVEMASKDMIFEPILEHGVFRFDCSVEHRKAAFPSVSFKNSKDREVSIVSHGVPAYIPTCDCLQDQQVVTFEVSVSISSNFLKTDLTMSILAESRNILVVYIMLTCDAVFSWHIVLWDGRS